MNITLEREALLDTIRTVSSNNFEQIALNVFQYQALHNPIYAKYLELLSVKVERIDRMEAIPFLPISLFKTHLIQTGEWSPNKIFTSSGTTGVTTSRHALRDKNWYEEVSNRCFHSFYSSISDYCVLALLPLIRAEGVFADRYGGSLD